MRLPADNSITLDLTTNAQFVLDRNVPPADPSAGGADVVATLLPSWTRAAVADGVAGAPIRDALAAAWAATANYAWARIGQHVAAYASPRFAAGAHLDAIHGARAHTPRVVGERDAAYRARLLAPPDVVSPAAIRAAVRALVADVTPVAPAFLEPAIDAMFWQTAAQASAADGPPWSCWWSTRTTRLWADYPTATTSTTPGAYWVDDQNRGEFWIVIPQGAGDDDASVYFVDGDNLAQQLDWFMSAPGTTLPTYWSDADRRFFAPDADSLIDRIVSAVEPRHGCGVRYFVFTDPNLAVAV